MDPIMFHAPSCAATAAPLVPPAPIGFGDDEVPLCRRESFWRQSEEISPEDECNDATSIIPTDVALLEPVYDGYPPLCRALFEKDWEGALALIAEGADVSEIDPDGMTPLHWACAFGCVDVVNAILGRFGDDDDARRKLVNQRQVYGPCTALDWAIGEGHPECALALIAAGCDRFECTAFHVVTHLQRGHLFPARAGRSPRDGMSQPSVAGAEMGALSALPKAPSP